LISLIPGRLRLFICGVARVGATAVGGGLGVTLLGRRHHAVGESIRAGPLLFGADTAGH
jgi:hypothetical protein